MELPPHRDPAQFDALVEEAGPDSILVVLARAMGPAVRAVCEPEDVWQETLALAWRDGAQHTWTDVRAWRSWVLTIGKNRIRRIARDASAEKRGGGRAARFADLGAGESVAFADLLPAGSVTPSRIASQRERARVLAEALASLSPEEQTLVHGHLFEERPMEEIAAELGLGLSAAWRRFRKAVEAYTRKLTILRSSTTPGPAAG